jgi:long-chain acyl-CoA synthetase
MDRNALRMVSLNDAWTTEAIQVVCANAAGRLRAKGVRPGDRVALVAANSTHSVLALLTLMHLDVSLVLLDERQDPAERGRALHRARVRWLICDRTVQIGQTGLWDGIERLELTDVVTTVSATPAPDFELDLSGWWAREDALIVFSSGTTGDPVGVVRSGPRLRTNTARTQWRMSYASDDVLLPLLPFSHQYGLSLLMLWWWSDSCLVLVPQTRLDHAIEAISRFRVTVVDSTPSTYHSLLRLAESRNITPAALDSVRMWCVGGAPLSPALARRFAGFTGKPLLDGYGSTEAGNIALSSPELPNHCGQPLEGIEIDVIGEDGLPVPDGTLGELVVRTPDLMAATLDEHGQMLPVTDHYYRTDDIGYRTAEGDIAVLGRKGAVHRLGHTLYPEALAHKAGACGAHVQVLDVPDERRGSNLVFVVADESQQDARDWRRAMRPHLATHEQPNHVLVVPGFPLNHNGKVNMPALRVLVGEALSPGAGAVAPADDQPDTSAVPLPERIPALQAVERYLTEHRSEVAAILTEVSNHRTVEGEIDTALETLRGAVREMTAYRPSLVRSTAVFMPSNIPLYAYVLYLLIPSLYSEHVVFRPSSHIRSQLGRLHELLSAQHRLPIELSASTQKQFVTGPVAGADLVVFTGTYANAERIRTRLGAHQLFVYFGQGINPFIVGPQADLDLAVRDLVEIRMLNSGQDCFGPDVVLVHDSMADRLHTLLAKQLEQLKFGAYTDPAAHYGAMYYEQAFGFILEYLHNNAEHIVYGGNVDVGKRWLQPTVLNRELRDTKPNCEELFAPIFNVLRYSSHDELHQTLVSPFYEERAMGAMVYGAPPETAELLAKRHEVCVDTTLLSTDNGNVPMGGRGMIANYVAFGGKRTAEPLLVSKAVADHYKPATGKHHLETA